MQNEASIAAFLQKKQDESFWMVAWENNESSFLFEKKKRKGFYFKPSPRKECKKNLNLKHVGSVNI